MAENPTSCKSGTLTCTAGSDSKTGSSSNQFWLRRLPLLCSLLGVLVGCVISPVFWVLLNEKYATQNTELLKLQAEFKALQAALPQFQTAHLSRAKRQASDGSYLSTACKDGKDGKDGSPGTPGSSGKDGKDGSDGPPGVQGQIGPKGQPGAQGLTGAHGSIGVQGSKGTKGDQGSTGASGIKGPKGDMGRVGPPGSPAGSGTSYIRWGRSVCPSGATKLYSGITAGGHFNQKGSGANHLCLPSEPQQADIRMAGSQSYARIYGGEYETHNDPFAPDMAEHDIPCTVCHIPRANHVMIPGWKNCTKIPGWSLEYSGYIMAAAYIHSKANYICVDGAPESYPGGQSSTDGHLLYTAEYVCGTLPCPPYVSGYEVPCAVCSK